MFRYSYAYSCAYVAAISSEDMLDISTSISTRLTFAKTPQTIWRTGRELSGNVETAPSAI